MVSELEERVRSMDDPRKPMKLVAREIASILGAPVKACYQHLALKRAGYSSQTEYKRLHKKKDDYSRNCYQNEFENSIAIMPESQMRSIEYEDSRNMSEVGETCKIIRRNISRLGPEIKAVIKKIFYENMSLRKCGKLYNVSFETIRQRRDKAFKKLQRSLRQLAEAS